MGTQEHELGGDDFAALFATGMPAAGQYHCASCGYGITLHSKLPSCPMCGGEAWELVTRSAIGGTTGRTSSALRARR